jgi:DNA-binding NtrC family response regulator
MDKILLVEDEEILAEAIADVLGIEGYQATRVSLIAQAKEQIENNNIDIILLDLNLPDGSGLDFLQSLTSQSQHPLVIVLTSNTSIETVVQAIRNGAFDFLSKPFDLDVLLHRIKNAVIHRDALATRALHQRLNELEKHSQQLVAPRSAQMRDLYNRVQKVAAIDTLSVLVTGETGVGKEHICRMIHDLSPRSKDPFVPINCATLDRTLLQSELFGHERGAFTGAVERRKGLFECASRGTLLLDEVSEIPMDVQAAFLRVLETKRFRRLGSSVELETNARIIAATNKDLKTLVKSNMFREDLYYRLNQVELPVPPLRMRTEDIQPLAETFCENVSRSLGLKASFTERALAVMKKYPWPGNLRELKHLIERTIVINGGGAISCEDLQLDNYEPDSTDNENPLQFNTEGNGQSDFPTLSQLEMTHIRQALDICGGNRTRAAKLLGIARSSLVRKLGEIE